MTATAQLTKKQITDTQTIMEALMANFVSVANVAKRFDVTTRTVVRWIDDGHFPGAFKLDEGIKNSPYLIPEKDVENYAKERKQQEDQNGVEPEKSA